MAKSKKATPDYARLHRGGLTLPQQNAVALLAAGKNDTETAAALGLNRVTVTRWRLYSPEFQAHLNVRRAELWSVAATKLQGLVCEALDVLAESLRNGTQVSRVAVAREVLKLAGQPPALVIGPTEPAAIARELVKDRRADALLNDVRLDDLLDLPSVEDHCREVWEELKERAGPAEPAESAPVASLASGSARPAVEALTDLPTNANGTND